MRKKRKEQKGKTKSKMGLTATSLRIAMLTARKSSLEFEGQQINQQRLTLSSQSAALFNSMLTMKVPTPPDPNEFSKMVYTFNAGYGESQILNVARNQGGGYMHNVTYKSPKTDSVLIKKPLNNVGFRFVNGQMSAIIDGMNYGLTLNGDEEELNEYMEKKETYDNIKNIESQIASLDKMSDDKVLTSSQMKQYFESLGLSSVETPQATVEDVETTDDAFFNLFNEGNDYEYETVTLSYQASTSPITITPTTTNVLKYDNNEIPTTGYMSNGIEICYNSEKGEYTWSHTLNSPSDLSMYGITHTEVYGYNDEDGNFQKGFGGLKFRDDNKIYYNIGYDDSGFWTYTSQQNTKEAQYIYKNIDRPITTTTVLDSITISGQTYERNGDYYQTTPTEVVNPSNIQEKYRIKITSSDSKLSVYGIEFNKNDKNDSTFTSADGCYTLDINDTSISGFSETAFGEAEDGGYYVGDSSDKQEIENFDQYNGYWYDLKNNCIVADKYGQMLKKDSKYNFADDFFDNQDIQNFVYVNKGEKDGKEGYIFEKFLTKNDVVTGDSEDNNNLIETYYRYNNKDYNKDNNSNIFIAQNGNNSPESIIYQDGNNWKTYNRILKTNVYTYTAGESFDPETRTNVAYDNLPPVIKNKIVIQDKYTYDDGDQDTSNDIVKQVDQGGEATVNGLKVVNNNNGIFTVSGTWDSRSSASNSSLPNGFTVGQKQVSSTEERMANGVTYNVTHTGPNSYSITASFNAWVNNNDANEKNYEYNQTNHSLILTPPDCVVAQMLWRNFKNERDEDTDTNITVAQMISFFESVLNNFGSYNSSSKYKSKLDNARNNYISTVDAPGVENPAENQALFNFIDANGKTAYLFVPLDYVNKDGQVDSTYAYMYSTTFLEGQTQTSNQNANVIYDENGRIAKITFEDGTIIIPEVKMEQDEEAYNAAMVKYDYEKQLYDKAISDINAKTEIIAKQDQNLELKLKTIDTAHTAIQTELEALNKVLDNNIKSGFNSFNA